MRWVALLAVVSVIAPASAGAATSVRLPSCGSTWYGGKVAPKTWDRGCTGTADLTSMVWEDWGAPSAVGRGVTMLNDCDPSCAEGDVSEVSARARVSHIQQCKNDRGLVQLFYTRIWLSADRRVYNLRCRR